MSTPYWAVGNDELKDLPSVKDGDEILCGRCNGRHKLEACLDEKGEKCHIILAYTCGKDTIIGAINGKLVAHAKIGSGGTIGGSDES